MLNSIRSRMTYANVVATMALFIALGGTSVAAVEMSAVQKRSITTRELAVQAVRNVNLGTNSVSKRNMSQGSVTGDAVKNGSLTNQDFGGTLPAGPQGPQGPAGPAGGGGSFTTATAPGTVTTTLLQTFEDLGGPSVTVTVPDSGVLEVKASAFIDSNGGVALYEGTQPVPGQEPMCGDDDNEGGIFSNAGPGPPGVYGTPPVPTFGTCGTVGFAGSMFINASPGKHTYTLWYADCGCGGASDFSNRTLSIAPRP